MDVSIHAPTRGATSFFHPLWTAQTFQSTRPHGARLKAKREWSVESAFQSTRPHGARHVSAVDGVMYGEFQSTRPHGARRAFLDAAHRLGDVSIHAPTRGATQILSYCFIFNVFQSTRPHGARLFSFDQLEYQRLK